MLKIIKTAKSDKYIIFEFYLKIPAGNNSANISWYDAATIASFEIVDIGGSYYIKTIREYKFSTRNLNDAQRLAEITSHHDTLTVKATTELSQDLNFTGKEIGGE